MCRSHNTGLLLLCEVSLGKPNKLLVSYNPLKVKYSDDLCRILQCLERRLQRLELAQGVPKRARVGQGGAV